jgi:hypothetical protein
MYNQLLDSLCIIQSKIDSLQFELAKNEALIKFFESKRNERIGTMIFVFFSIITIGFLFQYITRRKSIGGKINGY